ncbi:MAG TPA: hypothetical protein VNK95_06660 [Caldilineaceae bacterium]|nr:hypothetical protein [Caldilineaceae bacterium]
MKRRSYSASFTRTEATRRRSSARRRQAPPKSGYGPIFFLILGITVASALGFLGVVASVLAGS